MFPPQHEQQLRGLTEDKVNLDLVDLTDFDVQIALTQNDGVQFYEVVRIVTRFMIESFEDCFVDDEGTRAQFDNIVLLERTRRRQLVEVERALDSTLWIDCARRGSMVDTHSIVWFMFS